MSRNSPKQLDHSLRQLMRHSENPSSFSGSILAVSGPKLLKPLYHCLTPSKCKFLPTVIGGSISNLKETLLYLPTRTRRMGVHNPVESVEVAYSALKEATSGDTHQSVQTAAGARSGKVGYSIGVNETNEEACNHG